MESGKVESSRLAWTTQGCGNFRINYTVSLIVCILVNQWFTDYTIQLVSSVVSNFPCTCSSEVSSVDNEFSFFFIIQ